MLLFYIDESGTGLKGDQTNYFILASVAISDQYSSEVHKTILSLKSRISRHENPEDWEIKGRDIYQGKGIFDKRWEERVRIFLEIAEILDSIPCDIFAVKYNKEFAKKNEKDDTKLYKSTFNQLLENLDSFLKCCNETGILLMDSRSTHSSSVQDSRLITVFQPPLRVWVSIHVD